MSSDPYQAYAAYPSGAPLRLIDPPAVQLIAAGPAKQRRLTVAFRLILAIPHFFALVVLGFGGYFVVFIGWWAALFIGRLPNWAVSYLSGLARWNARVYGYMFLLTDVYPPFTVDDAPGYPVVIAIPEPQRLNRFAVFFRFILGIWAYIVFALVTGGASWIMLFVTWLITLVAGRMPAPLHLAYTAVLRYQTRYWCYMGLLTPTYPWKLFGDEPDPYVPVTPAPGQPTAGWPGAGWPAQPTGTMPPTQTMPPAETTPETATRVESAWDTPPAPDYPATTPYGTAPYGSTPGYGNQPGYGTPPGYAATPSYGAQPGGYGYQPGGYGNQPGGYAAPGYGAQPGYGTPESVYGTPAPGAWGSPQPPASPPVNWPLFLPRSAKNLLVVFIVFGVITNIGSNVVSSVLRDHQAASQAQAIGQWNTADNTLNAQMASWQTAINACDKSQSLTCATAADAKAAGYMSAFANQVRAIAMPTAATSSAAASVIADATTAAGDFTTVSQDTTLAQYQADMASSGLSPALSAVQTDISNLASAFNTTPITS